MAGKTNPAAHRFPRLIAAGQRPGRLAAGALPEPRRPPSAMRKNPETAPRQSSACPQTGLPCAARCLLYVGGRAQLCRYYRMLAERNGWSFVHHDGGLEVGLGRLAAVLPRADAVICPVDCVSHGAMKRVRHFCKRAPTRLLLLRSASLSAFAEALERLPPAGPA